jgi:hypothetical protein
MGAGANAMPTNEPPESETVTASQITDWEFCPESVRLRHVGAPVCNQVERAGGTEHHIGKAAVERRAGAKVSAGQFLLAIAFLAVLANLLWR